MTLTARHINMQLSNKIGETESPFSESCLTTCLQYGHWYCALHWSVYSDSYHNTSHSSYLKAEKHCVISHLQTMTHLAFAWTLMSWIYVTLFSDIFQNSVMYSDHCDYSLFIKVGWQPFQLWARFLYDQAHIWCHGPANTAIEYHWTVVLYQPAEANYFSKYWFVPRLTVSFIIILWHSRFSRSSNSKPSFLGVPDGHPTGIGVWIVSDQETKTPYKS